MYRAKIVRNFTWGKRGDQLFEAGNWIENLTEEDKIYLEANGVIKDITFVTEVEDAIEPKEDKVEKSVKKPIRKKK